MAESSLPKVTTSRILLSLSSIVTAVGPYVADWNETHVKNPRWPPHAKFHNGQTMSTGLGLGLLTAYFTWRKTPPLQTRDSLRTAAILGSFYWVTALSAIFYPGTEGRDPEFGGGFPQFWLFMGMMTLPWVGYGLGRGRLG